MTLKARVLQLWESQSESIAQVGLIGDDTGAIKFVSWSKAELPLIEEGRSYEFENVVTDSWQGRFSIKLNRTSKIMELEEDIEVRGQEVETVGALINVQDGSGLIKRCNECNRMLVKGVCAIHGKVEGIYDLRIKAVIDDGISAQDVLLPREITEQITGITLDEAKSLAAESLDPSIITSKIKEMLLGRYYSVRGPRVGRYILVEEINPTKPDLGEIKQMLEQAEAIHDGFKTPAAVDSTAASGEAPQVGDDNGSNGPSVRQLFRREVARRVFAQEFRESDLAYREGDDQYAPRYLLTPTGAKCNRGLLVGTLTEKDDISTESEYWRARIADPTGTFVVYTGQYQPEVTQALASINPPEFVSIVGKPNTYETDDGDIITSIRPESLSIVDTDTRDQWVLEASRQTIDRLSGMQDGDAECARAVEHYATDMGYYKQMVIDALHSMERTAVKTINLSKA